jgi:hypothetical protein
MARQHQNLYGLYFCESVGLGYPETGCHNYLPLLLREMQNVGAYFSKFKWYWVVYVIS